MASIRRTLLPANHDRSPHPNGASPCSLSSTSPDCKFHSNSKPSASISAFFFVLRSFLVGVFAQKQYRKGSQSWRRSVSRWCLFSIIGFLLGLMPSCHVDDIRKHNFSLQIEPQDVQVKEGEQSKGDFTIARPHEGEITAVSLMDLKMKERFDYKPRNLLIVVTPTYNGALQAYYLNRLGQVLRLVDPPILWIVLEMKAQLSETAATLTKMGVLYRHLVCTKNMANTKDGGVQQRNRALEHIEHHKLDGIVYFADEENIYSVELFESIRTISRFGTWPVAMLSQSKNKAIVEGPVCKETRVIGWHTNEKSKRLRRFHVDMSGFAFNSTILWDPRRWKRPYYSSIRQLDTVEGFQETTFIEQLVADESQMEGVTGSCGKIMNWHLHLGVSSFGYPRSRMLQNFT